MTHFLQRNLVANKYKEFILHSNSWNHLNTCLTNGKNKQANKQIKTLLLKKKKEPVERNSSSHFRNKKTGSQLHCWLQSCPEVMSARRSTSRSEEGVSCLGICVYLDVTLSTYLTWFNPANLFPRETESLSWSLLSCVVNGEA